ncbi:hypothetical protein [Cellulomonas sp.]|uniref:hypothetical protein n=1 Tax=Cellulomonas sp. TaxID=40001 RepID=UPI003BA9DC1A
MPDYADWLRVDSWKLVGEAKSFIIEGTRRAPVSADSFPPVTVLPGYFSTATDGFLRAVWNAPVLARHEELHSGPSAIVTELADQAVIELWVPTDGSSPFIFGGTLHVALGDWSGVYTLRGPSPAPLSGTYSSDLNVKVWQATPKVLPKIRWIEFWLNVFIASDEADAIPVPAGIHVGKTMVHGLPGVGDCFLTDQRTFDDDINAPSRVQLKGRFDTLMGTLDIKARAGPTVELDCEDGDVEGVGVASLEGVHWGDPRIDEDNGWIYGAQIRFSARVADPLVLLARAVGAVDLSGVINISTADRWSTADFRVSGRVDAYPHYEMYVRVDGGETQPVFRRKPRRGATALELLGNRHIGVTGSARLNATQ